MPPVLERRGKNEENKPEKVFKAWKRKGFSRRLGAKAGFAPYQITTTGKEKGQPAF